MIRSASVTLLFLILGIQLLAQETIVDGFTFDGLDRSWILYVPDSYTGEEEVPLLFNFHGYTSNAEDQMQYGDFRSIADTEGFLICHPEGTADDIGFNHWNVGWGFSDVDDVAFISALIDTLAANYAIDLDRVYSTGMSNGGFFSYHLACNLSDRIAAIASVTGSMSATTEAGCDPLHPTPVMQIHGTEDGTVPYDGFLFANSIPDVLDFWINQNGTDTEPVITPIPDIDMTDAGTADLSVYAEGDCGSEVQLYLCDGGGHTWPGAAVDIGATNQDFSASAVIWEFLAQYHLDELNCVVSVDDEYGDHEIQIYPNPATVAIEVAGEVSSGYQILDTQGKVVQEEKGWTGGRVDVHSLSAGTYVFTTGNLARRLLIAPGQ